MENKLCSNVKILGFAGSKLFTVGLGLQIFQWQVAEIKCATGRKF
jgi:hypothetical protein